MLDEMAATCWRHAAGLWQGRGIGRSSLGPSHAVIATQVEPGGLHSGQSFSGPVDDQAAVWSCSVGSMVLVRLQVQKSCRYAAVRSSAKQLETLVRVVSHQPSSTGTLSRLHPSRFLHMVMGSGHDADFYGGGACAEWRTGAASLQCAQEAHASLLSWQICGSASVPPALKTWHLRLGAALGCQHRRSSPDPRPCSRDLVLGCTACQGDTHSDPSAASGGPSIALQAIGCIQVLAI
mmetsp:Transcript_20279/g.36814  ORF Transcript_20279/g.36814 Transcript_20279/m.36814 type:complete len:236 (-) Transcript_20279:1161-1868(-)